MTDPVRLLEKLSEVTAPPRAEFRASLHELLVAEVTPRSASVAHVRRMRTAVVVAACLAVLAMLLTRAPGADPNGLEVVDLPPRPLPESSMAVLPDAPGEAGASHGPSAAAQSSRAVGHRAGSPQPTPAAPARRAPAVTSPTPAPPARGWIPDKLVFDDAADDAYPPLGGAKPANPQLSDPAYDIRRVSVTGVRQGTFRLALTLAAPPVAENSTYWVGVYLNADKSCYSYFHLDRADDDLKFNVYCSDGTAETRLGVYYLPGAVELRGNTLTAQFTPLDVENVAAPLRESRVFHGVFSRACPGGTSCTNANTFDEARSLEATVRWQ